ncbi:hypothetical protein P9112_004252 [Eukaryota sp. TZLM1-RC]
MVILCGLRLPGRKEKLLISQVKRNLSLGEALETMIFITLKGSENPLSIEHQIHREDRGYQWNNSPITDPDENLFFVAIDPNHSNLCGWTAGSFRNSTPVFERSGLLLNPKERRLNHPPPLTQATPNTYYAQSFQEYLIEISLPYVPESEEEPEYSSIMSGNLQRAARKKLRRNKFDFFIRRQKRITSFINKIKRLSEGRNTIVWFGNGSGGPSRQSVKSPRKGFLKQIKKHFESLKVGDEFMASAKVNCCKVFHRKIYHDDGRVNNAKFDCLRCQTNWSRDISASRNQLEIAIS